MQTNIVSVKVYMNNRTMKPTSIYIFVIFIIIDRFCLALFSALAHTHCALVACDSESVMLLVHRSHIRLSRDGWGGGGEGEGGSGGGTNE